MIPCLSAEIGLSALVPEMPVSTDGPIALDLLVFNATTEPQAWAPPRAVQGVLSAPGQVDRDVMLSRAAPLSVTVGPQQFSKVAWQVDLPDDVHGAWVLSVPTFSGAVWALRVAGKAGADARSASDATSPVPAGSATPTSGLVPRSELTFLERAFESRLGLHEDIYFIYGADDPVAKFQFSFKYRLIGFEHGSAPLRTLQFGYTQRSLWDINATSSPFYDTSYMPEVFYEWLAKAPEQRGRVSWLGLQSGFRHESNGRDEIDSRSLNIIYLRTGFIVGDIEKWRAIFGGRIFTYVGGVSDNPLIEDYRGNAELEFMFGRNGGIELGATARLGAELKKGSIELNLTVPVRLGGDRVETYLLVQYFSGYGESLLNYDTESETIRAGLSFVR